MSIDSEDVIGLTAQIVQAYVSKNNVPRPDLPGVIEVVHALLLQLSGQATAPPVAEAPREPAVPIRKSVTPNAIICLEDGKKFKSLKRHLMTSYGLTPVQYRAKWGLPVDYPMVAPAYSESRSALAKAAGLGRKAQRSAEPVVPAKPARAKRAPRAKTSA